MSVNASNNEIRVTIDEAADSGSSSSNSRTILSILSSNVNTVIAQINNNQGISSSIWTTNQHQQPTTTHNIIPEDDQGSTNQDNLQPNSGGQEEEQYIIIWVTILKTCIQYLPLLLILLLKCTFDNFQVLVEVSCLHLIIWYLNLKFKVEVAKKAKRSQPRLAILLIYILVVIHFLVIYLISDTTRLGLFLVYSDTSNVTLSTLFYQVIITDCILKFVTIFTKICIAILPIKCIQLKKRSRSYAFIEFFSQCYRSLAPVHIWLDYFFFAYNGWKTVFGGLFCSLYLGYKSFDLTKRFQAMRKGFLTLYRNVNHGRTPTELELASSENQCPICHDNFNEPVILECSHIFCENCVTTWFANEQTCPLCRAKVAENPSWQCGSTSLFYQIY